MNNFNTAKWIAASKKEDGAAPMLRKSFVINKNISKATLCVCGLGHGIYHINGKSVTDDVLLTPVTKYDTTVLYNKYDVTCLLKSGTNVMTAVLGNGWYCTTYPRWDVYKAPWFHHPKLIVCLKLEYADNTTDYINSDSSWKVLESPIVYNETRRGEIYDARLEIKDVFEESFDDSGLNNAFVCRSPGGVLKEATLPPIRVTKEIVPEKISENVYDLKQNISGWVKIKVRGKRGTEITFRYAELLNDDGSINPEELNTILGSRTHTDKYILKGDGTEEWAPHFAYHGFRYAEVTGAPDDFEIIGQVVHTDLKITGSFECSSEMLNKIHSAARWSTLTNMHGFPTDCPQREQNAWTGDALLSADQTLINYDATELYRKWLGDIRDSQRPSGQISCIAPTGGWGYNWGTGPAWDSVLIHLPYLAYKYSGDLLLVKENWDSMKKYMDFMDSMSEDYIVDYGLGDWLAPKETDVTPNIITDTCYYMENYRIMAKCALLMNESPVKYEDKAKKIKEAFRNRFLKEDLYLGSRQTALAAAIYFDVYTKEEKQKALNRLTEVIKENDNRLDCGVLGTKYMFGALSENGYCDLMYKMVTNPKMPSYAYWIENGMTTLCEYWDMTHSCNHHMYSEVDMWLYKYIAGIRLDEGGKSVLIKPCFTDGVTWAKAQIKNVSVQWNEEEICVSSDIPARVEADGKIYNLGIGRHTIKRK